MEKPVVVPFGEEEENGTGALSQTAHPDLQMTPQSDIDK